MESPSAVETEDVASLKLCNLGFDRGICRRVEWNDIASSGRAFDMGAVNGSDVHSTERRNSLFIVNSSGASKQTQNPAVRARPLL